MPPDYRSLMLLSLAALDFFIVSSFSQKTTLAKALHRGREGLFRVACDFIGVAGDDALDGGLFYDFVGKASAFDPFELTLNLAEIFREESGDGRAFPLADLVDIPSGFWKTVLEAAAFCRAIDAETAPRRVAVQAKFISRHSQKILRGKTQDLTARIEWPQYLYFHFYCTASAKGLFKAPPQSINIEEACRFTCQLVTQMAGRPMAALTAIRLWQAFAAPGQDKSEEIAKIYKLALFDRSRKAFSLLSQPGSEAVMTRPESPEQTVIFDRNSF